MALLSSLRRMRRELAAIMHRLIRARAYLPPEQVLVTPRHRPTITAWSPQCRSRALLVLTRFPPRAMQPTRSVLRLISRSRTRFPPSADPPSGLFLRLNCRGRGLTSDARPSHGALRSDVSCLAHPTSASQQVVLGHWTRTLPAKPMINRR